MTERTPITLAIPARMTSGEIHRALSHLCAALRERRLAAIEISETNEDDETLKALGRVLCGVTDAYGDYIGNKENQ